MNKQTPTKRATRRIAASIAIVFALATTGAWAASRYWTGAEDTIWDNTGNWENGNIPGNDEVHFRNDKFDSKFTSENGSVITFTNSFAVWRTRLRGAGSELAPLVFRATDSNYGLDFGTSVGIIVADSSGSGYLRIESGTYPSSAGIRIGENATYYGQLTVTGGAVLKATNGNLDIQNGKVVLDNGTIEISKTGNSVSLSKVANGCELHLESGGVLTTSLIWDGNQGKTSTVLFNGGTLKANGVFSSSWPAIIADKQNISVNVGAKGGTIDASGFDIQVARPIEPDGSSTGGMTFKGGGSVTLTEQPTYTGDTTVEVGTTLVVPSAIAGDKLAFAIPEGVADGVYEVVRISGEGTFAEDVVDHASRPSDENARFFLNSAKTRIYCCYGELDGDGKVWVGIAGDGKLSTAENWLGNTVPANGDVLNFSMANTAVSLDADLGEVVPATILFGTKPVTIANGKLTVNTLTNANTLAVGAGASLEVDGDIVAKPSTWGGEAHFLYSNEGSVIVHGNAVGIATGTASVYEYTVGNANTKPMQVGGIRYEAGGNTLYFHINSAGTYYNQDPGSWVVGGNGIGFVSGRENGVTHYYTQYGGSVMLHSSADWTLANSMKNNTSQGEIMMSGNGAITFDTSDYGNPTVPRTITLQGRLYANNVGMGHSAFIIDGCGTVVVDTADMSSVTGIAEPLKHTCITNSILHVMSDATLQVNAGKKITGANGRIALDAGATLALVSSGTADFAERIEPALNLPAEGAAKIRIDGIRLRSGDHVIANVASGADANVTLDSASNALYGRKGALRVEDGKLILSVNSRGLMVIFM